MRPTSIAQRLRRVGRSKWALCLGPVVVAAVQVRVYFLRELLAAELILLAAFVLFMAVSSVCYFLGAVAEGVHWLAKQVPQILVKPVEMKPLGMKPLPVRSEARVHART